MNYVGIVGKLVVWVEFPREKYIVNLGATLYHKNKWMRVGIYKEQS